MALATEACNVGMIGFGTVGRGVARILHDHAELFEKRFGRRVTLRKVLVRDADKALDSGEIDAGLVTTDLDAFLAESVDVVVEVAGGVEPIGSIVRDVLSKGRHVVTANKALLAADGPALFALARQHDVSIAFEASCGGGIPCVTALTGNLMGNAISGLYGILNGTCNYILTEMTQGGKTYGQALSEAKEKGYAEADETLDVSGADAGQKLAILASLAFGVNVTGSDVPTHGIDALDLDDVRFGDELGYDIKLIASAERWPGEDYLCVNTAPCFIAKTEQLAQVHGSFNALSVVGDAVGHTMFYGRGAGQLPTASAVVGDLLAVACGAYPMAFKQTRLTPDLAPPPSLVETDDIESRWYMRINALDVPGVMAKVTKALGDRGISLSALLQHDATSSDTVPVVITTHHARLGDVRDAAATIEALPEVHGSPVLYRILDLPK